MAEVQLAVPSNLGLSQDQMRKLGEQMQSHLVGVLRGAQAEALVNVQAKVIEQAETVNVVTKAKAEF